MANSPSPDANSSGPDEPPAGAGLLDPELAPLAAAFPRIALSDETLASLRSNSPLPTQVSDAARAVRAEELKLRSRDGAEIVLALYRPAQHDAALPVILHMHGGGYIAGSVAASAARNRETVASLGCAVASVDYRLAPEHPFPAALDDCYSALAWLATNGGEYGLDPRRIVLKGESAGGGLAAALALLARDRGEYRPVFQHLTYPMLDDRTGSTIAPHPHSGGFVWTRDDNRFAWSAYLGAPPGSAATPLYAAPGRAADLAGLPPAFIMTGGLDLFCDENIAYARRLAAEAVPVELHVFPGAFHGFDLAESAEIARQARASAKAALARALREAPGDVAEGGE